jgi:hypothetical protein
VDKEKATMGDSQKAGKDDKGEIACEVQLGAPFLFHPRQNPSDVSARQGTEGW